MPTPPVGTTLFDGIQFSDPNEIEAVLLSYGAVRSGVLEEAVRIDNADQSTRNQRINDLNRINTILQRARPNNDVVGATFNLSQAEFADIRTFFVADLNRLFSSNNVVNNGVIEVSVSSRGNGFFQQMLDIVRNQVDQASANSQLELIALQALINRRNQAVEFTTNLVQRFSSLKDRIIGNIRN